MLKLTLPNQDNLYADCIAHPRVLKVVRCRRLFAGRGQQAPRAPEGHGRELLARADRGLTAQQSDAEFDAALDAAIESIYQASKT